MTEDDASSIPVPLTGDPDRNASESIGGYDYQLWRSLLAWLELGDNELLCLEAAEDFDVISREHATAVQVKRTAGRFSLNTKRAAEALENYLSILALNPGRRIHYRYLTTSEAALEEGAPFGPGVPGLAVWEECRKVTPTPAAEVFAHVATICRLVRNHAVECPLVHKLLTEPGSGLVFYRDIMRRFEWATGEPGTAAVRERVHEILISRGSRLGFPPSEAPRVASVLRDAITRAASERPLRALRRSDLLVEIEAATRVSLPRASVDAILAQAAGREESDDRARVDTPEAAWTPDALDLSLLDGDRRFSQLCLRVGRDEFPGSTPIAIGIWDNDREILQLMGPQGDPVVWLTKFVEGDIRRLEPLLADVLASLGGDPAPIEKWILCVSCDAAPEFLASLEGMFAAYPMIRAWEVWDRARLTKRLESRPDVIETFFFPVSAPLRRTLSSRELELVRFELEEGGAWSQPDPNVLVFSKATRGGDLVLDVIVRNTSAAELILQTLTLEQREVERKMRGLPGDGLLYPQITYRVSLHGGENGRWREKLEPPLIVRPGAHERFKIALCDTGYGWHGQVSLSIGYGDERQVRLPSFRTYT